MLAQQIVFGGTFDPVHRGHIAAAEAVFLALQPQAFRFLPAGDPPHRAGTFAAPADRLRMLELALAAHPQFTIDTRELERPGPSWMSLTLQDLRESCPDDAIVLLLGQDSANSLDQWHEWRSLLELAHLLVMTRPGAEADYSPGLSAELGPRITSDRTELARTRAGKVLTLDVAPVPVSSTQLRACIQDPEALRRMVPDPVAAYIERHQLYR